VLQDLEAAEKSRKELKMDMNEMQEKIIIVEEEIFASKNI
jgi:hypothetical protein